MGSKGRHIHNKTASGVKFGGGLISDYSKNRALEDYEKTRITEGVAFQPILQDGTIDTFYKRFPEFESNNHGRSIRKPKKKGAALPVYIGAVVNIHALFKKRLHEFVLLPEFADFKYNVLNSYCFSICGLLGFLK